MSKLAALTWLELRGLYGINKWRHTRDARARGRYRLLAGAFAVLLALAVFYVGGLAWGLCALGLAFAVPAYLAVLASLLILAFGIFKAGPLLFSSKGYDLLAAMPVKPGAVAASRLAALYAEDLLLALVILLPGCGVYAVLQRPGLWFYPAALVGWLLLPAIPLVVSALLGTLVMAVSARVKHKSLVQTALMLLVVLAVLGSPFFLSGTAETVTLEQMTQLAANMGAVLARIYPPAGWLAGGLLGTNWRGFALFAALSLGVLALCMAVLARCFACTVQAMATVSARQSYRMGTLASRSLRKALYLREAKRYFSSSVYVTNTIIGPIMGCGMALAVCLMGLDEIAAAIPLPVPLADLLPVAVAGVFCMMTTTSTSISMEGRQFWVVKSMPIPTRALLDAKILLNLSLMAPFWLVALVCLVAAARPGPGQLLWYLLLPALLMAFSCVLGITVNLKLHSFDWEKEEAVVKQSAAAALGGFAGMLLAMALAALLIAVPAGYTAWVKVGSCLALAAGTPVLYEKNNSAALEAL